MIIAKGPAIVNLCNVYQKLTRHNVLAQVGERWTNIHYNIFFIHFLKLNEKSILALNIYKIMKTIYGANTKSIITIEVTKHGNVLRIYYLFRTTQRFIVFISQESFSIFKTYTNFVEEYFSSLSSRHGTIRHDYLKNY